MASITPINQTSTLDPYQGTLFEYNNVDSRVYLSRTINSLLNVYGRDVIIDGFKPVSFNYSSNSLQVTFSAGTAIADQTLIETPNQIITSAYNTVGLNMSNVSIAFFIRFQYLQQFASNQFSVKSVYVDNSGIALNSDVFDINSDRICLAVFDFDVTGTVATQRPTNTYLPLALRSSAGSLIINANTMPIYPISTIADTTASVIRQALA